MIAALVVAVGYDEHDFPPVAFARGQIGRCGEDRVVQDLDPLGRSCGGRTDLTGRHNRSSIYYGPRNREWAAWSRRGGDRIAFYICERVPGRFPQRRNPLKSAGLLHKSFETDQ